MKRTNRLVLAFIILLITVGADQIAKVIAQRQLASTPPIFLANGALQLFYIQNQGAFLSPGANMPAAARFIIFVLLGSVLVAGVFYLIAREESLDGLQVAALSLLASGGVGNLLDRLLHNGQVVDFMRIEVGIFHTGVFNVADVAIMAGVFAILLSLIKSKKGPQEPARPSDQDSTIKEA